MIHSKCELNTTYDKCVIEVSLWMTWQLSYYLAFSYVADAYCPKEAAYQIWTQYEHI